MSYDLYADRKPGAVKILVEDGEPVLRKLSQEEKLERMEPRLNPGFGKTVKPIRCWQWYDPGQL